MGLLALATTASAGCGTRYLDEVTQYGPGVYGHYKPEGGRDFEYELWQPRDDPPSLRRPAVIHVHGGGFRNGQHGSAKPQDSARRGYVGMSINYRLFLADNPRCELPENADECLRTAALIATEDAKAAVGYLRDNADRFRIDPSRIAIRGGSAGAGTALLVALLNNDDGNGNPVPPDPRTKVQAAVSEAGALPPRLTPTSIFDAGDAPIIGFHGTADCTAKFADAVWTAQRIRAAGIPFRGYSFLGTGHGFGRDVTPIVRKNSHLFFYEHMNLREADGHPNGGPGPAPPPYDEPEPLPDPIPECP